MRHLLPILVVLLSSSSLFSQDLLTVELAADLGVKLGGCAIGDVDPTKAGAEIVAVAADGRVFVIWNADGVWQHEVAYKATGELIQVAIGDANTTREGLEIVAVGMKEGDEHSGGPGAVYLIQRTAEGWKGQPIFEDKALVHGVAVSEGSIFAVGFSLDIHLITRQDDGSFKTKQIGKTPAPGKNAAFDGKRLFVCCTDGHLWKLTRQEIDLSEGARAGDPWRVTWSGGFFNNDDKREAGRARIALHGKDRLVADDDGSLIYYQGSDLLDFNDAELVHKEEKKLRGAVFADLDHESEGLELGTVGYEGKLTIFRGPAHHRVAHCVYTDPQGLHHLAAGDLDGQPGDELATCGYAGRVIVVRAQRAKDEKEAAEKKKDD